MRGGHVAQAWPLAVVFHAPLRRLLQARVMQSDRDWDAALWPILVPLRAAISEIMRAARHPVIRSWVSSNLPGPGRRGFIPARLVVS
jgi:hypothetical protein